MKYQRQNFKLTFCIILCSLFLCVSVSGKTDGKQLSKINSSFETRCGWLGNPSPGNIWLRDRDTEWLIGAQGGDQTKGEWPWPAFKANEWVKTNDHYGYGCACLKLRVDRKERRVIEIKTSKVRPLAACIQDKALKRWEGTLE